MSLIIKVLTSEITIIIIESAPNVASRCEELPDITDGYRQVTANPIDAGFNGVEILGALLGRVDQTTFHGGDAAGSIDDPTMCC